MNNLQPPQSVSLVSQKDAETIGRLFNLLFNSGSLYGPTHQSVRDNSLAFFNGLNSAFKTGHAMVTIIHERGSVTVEGWPVDKIVNVRRIAIHFRNTGIESVSFSKDVSADSIFKFMQIFTDAERYKTVDKMVDALKLQNNRAVLLNYVVYRKVTADEAVVNKDATDITKINLSLPDATPALSPFLNEVAGLFALKERLLRSNTPLADNKDSIQAEAQRFALQKTADSNTTADQIIDTVTQLKFEIHELVELQKSTGRLNSNQATPLVDQLQNLSHQVMVRLILQEYQNGTVSVKRLGQIIRRMLPDIKELKTLLPAIKEALVNAGMPLSDYLQLVKDLDRELSDTGLLQMLADASQTIGVSVDEIVAAIKTDPQDAARLLVLAAGIRDADVGSESQLSTVLSQYVEQVSCKLTLSTPGIYETGNNGQLKSILIRLEHQILDRLKQYGLGESTLQTIAHQLSIRLPETLGTLKAEWLADYVRSHGDINNVALAGLLEKLVEHEQELDPLRNQLQELLAKRGYTAAQLQELLRNLPESSLIAEESKKTGALPKGVLNNATTLYFLEHEIKRSCRYESPFSTIAFAIESIDGKRILNGTDAVIIAEILNQLLNLLKETIRDLDLVGSLGWLSENIPFVILPMTDADGVRGAISRIKKIVARTPFTALGKPIKPTIAISPVSFDKATTPDRAAYMRIAAQQIRQERERLA